MSCRNAKSFPGTLCWVENLEVFHLLWLLEVEYGLFETTFLLGMPEITLVFHRVQGENIGAQRKVREGTQDLDYIADHMLMQCQRAYSNIRRDLGACNQVSVLAEVELFGVIGFSLSFLSKYGIYHFMVVIWKKVLPEESASWYLFVLVLVMNTLLS